MPPRSRAAEHCRWPASQVGDHHTDRRCDGRPRRQNIPASRPAATVAPSSLALIEVFGPEIADDDDRRARPPSTCSPATMRSTLRTAPSPSVLAFTNSAYGQARRLVEQLVVDALEEVLERARHVPEVLGRSDDRCALHAANVVGGRVERALHVRLRRPRSRRRSRPRPRRRSSRRYRPNASGTRRAGAGRPRRPAQCSSTKPDRSNVRCSRTSPTWSTTMCRRSKRHVVVVPDERVAVAARHDRLERELRRSAGTRRTPTAPSPDPRPRRCRRSRSR